MNAIVNKQQSEQKNDIIDIHIGGNRKRIRIDGDDNRILYINTSDMGIMRRITEAYPKLKAAEEEFMALSSGFSSNKTIELEEDIAEISSLTEKLKNIDNEMRMQLDYIFDANVSEVCCDGGSMCDIVDGYTRYEIIIDSLGALYEVNLKKEKKRIEERMKQHTSKYTRK